MRVFVAGRPVLLADDAFVADGGEARVFAVGYTAYKVFHQPVDPARLGALQRLRVPHALLPQQILVDEQGTTVGHSMRYLPSAVPWAKLLSRSYRDRHGVDDDHALRLVHTLSQRVRAVHRAGAQIVDLHAGNLLLDAGHAHPVLIDTSSWQLPGFPATAIQDLVRDRHATTFDEGTDWFAFAVVATQLLLGIHPYRGTHPSVKGVDARMVARLSVFRPEVRLPAVCPPRDLVPPRWRSWLQAVLDSDHRGPPPTEAPDATSWAPQAVLTTRRLALTELLHAQGPLAGVVEVGARTLGWTPLGAPHDGSPPWPVDAVAISVGGSPVGARCQGGSLVLHDLDRDVDLPLSLRARSVQSTHTGFVVLSGARLVELTLHDGPHGPVPLPRLLATVAPEATQLFPGLFVERLLGRTHLGLLGPGRCDRRPFPALDGWSVLHAAHHRGVVALVAERGGQLDRYVLRVGTGGIEVRHTADVATADLELVVTPRGLAALQVDGRLELFRANPHDDGLRAVEDPALTEGRLVGLGHQLGLLQQDRLYRMSLQG